ncbi:phosphate regulon sensor histidine kinase PhoR [Luteibacter sp. 22Crub2.1]|uniref:phosphate regulon sensor histidine kinase PhoR n=1 Tax=Luteibacter sp. 22Crub2.1 TaxID=1283288 RepID=UPI0009A6FC79|nr:phosphate regulon sensor histidine kinase PhoR [Luteibacter sp. 22Crub2.1]SKC06110.1 two-component system, OmpR family, phosphate regulon sensor histidine kinase PhoR [Luteibacter sp. 22Crub2.1]
MPQRFLTSWRLPASCAALLLLGGAVGWLTGTVWPCVTVVALGETVVLLSLFRHKSGPMLQSSATPHPDHDRLMTRTRRIASRLRDLRSAAGTLPDAVVLLDHSHHVRWFNHAAEDLLGLKRPRDRGRVLADLMRNTDLSDWLAEGAREPLNDVTAPGHPNRHVTATLLPFGSRQRLLLARDTSHLTRLEQIRRDFVANVSHELRTPLTVIHGYLELLDPEDVPELAPVLDEMRAQSKRMGQIVEDLLTLSRLETQEHVADEQVQMAPLLASLRKEAEALSQGRHTISLDVATAHDLLGSPKDLHSAFSNLVSNAVRYTPTGGKIAIRWADTEDGARFSVHDSGFGIPAAHIARLTERFYRVSSSRSRDSGGTGLGLSIVKHVLNLHQARLVIESETGKGSVFACVFVSDRLLDSTRVHETAGLHG